MAKLSSLQKIILGTVGAGVVGGGYYHLNKPKKIKLSKEIECNIKEVRADSYTPTKWNKNWDCRDTETLRTINNSVKEQNGSNSDLVNATPKATRHLYLIRHGQYNEKAKTDEEKTLTEKGRAQAKLTGERLKALNIKWDSLIISPMTRAQETSNIIAKYLPSDLKVEVSELLAEGQPFPPEPPSKLNSNYKDSYLRDGARVEEAFKKLFHRALPIQTKDENILIVCHANIIRYLVCRALQFPPEGWLRISLRNGSITKISIHSDGSVILHSLGDTGHIDPGLVTSKMAPVNGLKSGLWRDRLSGKCEICDSCQK